MMNLVSLGLDPSNIKVVFLRVKDASQMSGVSVSGFYSRISGGVQTPGKPVSDRCKAWPEHELLALNAARLRGATTDELKELTQLLMELREKVGIAASLQEAA